VNDPLWKNYYEDVYRGFESPKLRELDWFCVLGNHDWIKNPIAQIEYNKLNPKWNIQMNYTKEIQFSQTLKAQMIFMETSRYFELERNRVPKLQNYSASEMTDWLRKTLEEGDGKYVWRFVYGHYPFYSSGHYGDVGHTNMTVVEDLLVKHKVDAYFSGHQHILQHLEVPYKDHKVQYFISGAGGQTISNDIRNPNHTYNVFARGREEGFMIHTLNHRESKVEVIGKEGQIIHTNVLRK
jgi:tartrate-resistant acid phosphatase type 5